MPPSTNGSPAHIVRSVPSGSAHSPSGALEVPMSPMSPLPPVDRRTFIRSLAGVGGAALATAYALPAWAESLGGDVALLGPWSDQIGLQLFTVRAIDDPHSDWSSPRPAWLVFGADHGAILPPHLAAAGPRANWQARKKRIDRRK